MEQEDNKPKAMNLGVSTFRVFKLCTWQGVEYCKCVVKKITSEYGDILVN